MPTKPQIKFIIKQDIKSQPHNSNNNNLTTNKENYKSNNNTVNIYYIIFYFLYYTINIKDDLDLLKSQEQFKESAEVKAYCYGLPKEWSKGQLKLYFDEKLNFQSGITNIYYAYNKIGEFTGKATIVFKNENLKENWVTK